MSSCDQSNIKKNYIVQSAADFDILSACTGFYTNNIYNCTGDTLTLHSTIVSANTINASVYLSGGTNLLDIFGSLVDNNTFVTGYTYNDANTFTISDNSGSTFSATINNVTGLTVNGGLSATTISACTSIYTSNLYGCSPITVHDSIQSINSSATGTTSFAFGIGAQAYGDYSHAEGKSTTAIGENSHAEGQITIASGKNSHAEGYLTTAGGFYSHAEGSGSETTGTASHAEGLNTTASNQGSHAEGGSTTASGLYSHAEGKDTTASGHYSHAGGRGINSSQIVASGETSFVHFRVATGGGFGPNHGAYGDYSAILGGNDHNIGYGSTSSGIFAGSDNIINDNVLRSVILGGGNITGTTDDTAYVPYLNVNLIGNDNSLTQILSRDSSDGTIKYRDVQSIISAATSQDTFVTGFTYSPNTLTITRNDGTGFTTNISEFSTITVTGLTVDSDAQFNDNVIVDGNTLIKGNVTILGTATTINSETVLIKDNILTLNSTATGTTVPFPVDSGLEILRNSATTSTLLWEESNQYWSAGLSGSTSKIILEGDSLSLLVSGHTHPIGEVIGLQSALDGKVGDGVNVGSGAGEIFSGKSGTTLNFRTLSGGSNTTLTTIGDVVKIDVAVPSGDNFFSTAGTVTQSATTGDTAITLQIVGTSGFSPYSITGITDTFVNDFTFSSNTFTITQNDGSSFDSSIETIELGNILSAVTFDIETSGSISATTFNGDTFSGGTFYGDGSNLTGIDNFYVTGGTITGETTVVLTRNDNVNIPVTGITSTGLFGQHTGDTNNPHVVTISQLSGVSETLFNTYTGDTETVLLTKVEDGNNVGGATEVFRDKTGTTLNFRTLSGGTNTTVTTIGDVNRIDVSIPTDLNTFVTGFTYNDNNTFTINDNVGSSFTATINQVSGLTVNGTLSATTLDGSVILSGGTNLTTIIEGFDTYVTGGTVSISATTDTNSSTIGLLYKNSEGIPHTLPFYDTFTTGATYDNGTALVTFDKNDGTNYF